MYPGGTGLVTQTLSPGAALADAEGALSYYTGVLQSYQQSLIVPPAGPSGAASVLIIIAAVAVAAWIVSEAT